MCKIPNRRPPHLFNLWISSPKSLSRLTTTLTSCSNYCGNFLNTHKNMIRLEKKVHLYRTRKQIPHQKVSKTISIYRISPDYPGFLALTSAPSSSAHPTGFQWGSGKGTEMPRQKTDSVVSFMLILAYASDHWIAARMPCTLIRFLGIWEKKTQPHITIVSPPYFAVEIIFFSFHLMFL